MLNISTLNIVLNTKVFIVLWPFNLSCKDQTKNKQKMHIWETLALSTCEDNSIVSKNKTIYFCPIWNTTQFQGSAQGRSTSQAPPTWGRSIIATWNNSLFLRIHKRTINESNNSHAWTIHNCNLEQLLVLRLNAGMIYESNPEQLLVFKAPRGDDTQVQSGTTPCS